MLENEFITFFNYIASLSSIISLILTFIVYKKIKSLKEQIGLQAIQKTVLKLFNEIENIPIPDSENSLTKGQTLQVEQLLKYLEQFFISKRFWKQKTEKKLIKMIKDELSLNKRTEAIKTHIKTLKEQVIIFEIN